MNTIWLLLSLTSLQQVVMSQMKNGDGTFYGQGGAGKQGSCLLDRGFNGVSITCAMNPHDYGDGSSCGRCVRIIGEGNGVGMTPIIGPLYATIDNLCPECKDGDVDLGLGGDGRWRIQWNFVSCQEARTNRSLRSLSNKKWSSEKQLYYF
jgi:hypothetical protein